MNEDDKMLNALPYRGDKEPLTAYREECRKKIFDLNHHFWTLEEKEQKIREILGEAQEILVVELPFRCEYGRYIKVGNHFYANMNLLILDGGGVEIGDNVMIGPNVSMFTATHPLHADARNSNYEYAKKITIGNDVWIGGNVVINPGVNIGNGTIIGSGSVVTKNIPEYCVAAGNPCRVIKYITNETREKEMQEIDKYR